MVSLKPITQNIIPVMIILQPVRKKITQDRAWARPVAMNSEFKEVHQEFKEAHQEFKEGAQTI